MKGRLFWRYTLRPLSNLGVIAMKKSLIGLAVLAASGAAMAQSSVTLFGVVDTGIGYVSGGTQDEDATVKGKNQSWSGLQNNGNVVSRLGFRGTEDLGNGLKANFWLEGAIAPDTGATALDFQRRSTIGLSGSFGEVRLGRELTAAYNATSRYDVMGQAGYGSSQLWGLDRENRVSNAVTYISPNFNGFAFGLNYGFGEDRKVNNDGTTGKYSNSASRYLGAGLTYDNGPISLGLGLERQNKGASTQSFDPDEPALGGVTTTAWSLGGSYNFGVAKLTAAYRRATDKNDNLGFFDNVKIKNQGFLVGVSAPVGTAGEIRATYNHYRAKLDEAGAPTLKANQFAVGYVHNLSKRTALYGTYAYIKNSKKQDEYLGLGLNGADIGLKNNGSQHGLQAGIRHTF